MEVKQKEHIWAGTAEVEQMSVVVCITKMQHCCLSPRVCLFLSLLFHSLHVRKTHGWLLAASPAAHTRSLLGEQIPNMFTKIEINTPELHGCGVAQWFVLGNGDTPSEGDGFQLPDLAIEQSLSCMKTQVSVSIQLNYLSLSLNRDRRPASLSCDLLRGLCLRTLSPVPVSLSTWLWGHWVDLTVKLKTWSFKSLGSATSLSVVRTILLWIGA